MIRELITNFWFFPLWPEIKRWYNRPDKVKARQEKRDKAQQAKFDAY